MGSSKHALVCQFGQKYIDRSVPITHQHAETGYVVEALTAARALGFRVKPNMLQVMLLMLQVANSVGVAGVFSPTPTAGGQFCGGCRGVFTPLQLKNRRHGGTPSSQTAKLTLVMYET